MKRKKVTAITAAAVLTAIMISGCGSSINASATFATLDDTKITMGVANFYTKYQQAVYDQGYMPYFGEDMWSQDLYGNGSTMEADVKSDAVEQLENMYLLKAHMSDYDISLSDEEEKKIEEAANAFMKDNTKKALKQVGADSAEDVKEMLRLQTIRSKMHARIIEDADTTVTDEEAAQRTFSYVQVSTAGSYDESSNYVEYTDEEKADLKKQADTVASGEDFEKAAEEAGLTVSTESYGSAKDEDATLDAAVLEAADTLTEGQMSGVIETESGYYVIRLDSSRDETASAAKKEELITKKQEDHYNDILDGWKEKAKWELNQKEWDKISFRDHFTSEQNTENASEALNTEGTGATETASGTESIGN